MEPEGSITRCIDLLKRGDRAAAQELWGRYFERLVGLARAAPVHPAPRRRRGGRGPRRLRQLLPRGRTRPVPPLADRDDLWQLLFVITVRKAIDLVHHEGRPIRGGGRVLDPAGPGRRGRRADLGPEPTPALAAQVADEYRRLLDGLGDESLRSVALWKLEGYTNDEIAARLGCVRQTVERKLRRIRTLWAGEMTP